MDNQWDGKHVLVTGGLGFLGSHFVEELLKQGAYVSATTRRAQPWRRGRLPRSPNVRLVELDLLDEEQIRVALCGATPRVAAIVHCAGMDGNADFKRRHGAQILDVNLRLASHVLTCARDAQVQTVAIASSAEIYRCPDIRISRLHTGRLEDGYILAKMFSELLAELHRKQYGTRTFLLRFTNVYGPRDRFDSTARVIPAMVTRISTDGSVDVWGDGSQACTFIYATDAVRAALQVVAQDKEHVVDIGTAESVSVLDLARLIFDLMDVPERINSIAAGRPRSSSRALDVSTMNSLIDFTPRTLRDGLAETVRWYRAQHEVERGSPSYSGVGA